MIALARARRTESQMPGDETTLDDLPFDDEADDGVSPIGEPIEEPIALSVDAGAVGQRVDTLLAERSGASRSQVKRWIELGRVHVAGRAVRASRVLALGETIEAWPAPPVELSVAAEAIPLVVLFEDMDVIVVDKPAGLVVHPAPGHPSGTLVNALLHHFQTSGGTVSTIGGKERPGLVHRLDKETSGVMVIAKTDHAHRALAAQFKHHTITRVYEALIWGVPKKGHGLIELAIGRDTKERKKFSSRTTSPKESATEYKVDHRYGKLAAHVLLYPRTGRTHQLRVHLTSLGHPILGDPTYGGRKVCTVDHVEIPRVMLHARTLGFQHPTTGEVREFTRPFPSDMEAVTQALEQLTHQKSSKES